VHKFKPVPNSRIDKNALRLPNLEKVLLAPSLFQ